MDSDQRLQLTGSTETVRIPAAVSKKLAQIRTAITPLLVDAGHRVGDARGVYDFEYMGFESGYRGHIGNDCTACAGDQAFVALHPANHYYRIERLGEPLGYVGLTEAHVPGLPDLKVLALDTIQSPEAKIPSEAIPNILEAIEKIARSQGYVGVALSDSLEDSFNHAQVREAITSLPTYQKGAPILLVAQYPEATKLIERLFQNPPSASIETTTFRMITKLDDKTRSALKNAGPESLTAELEPQASEVDQDLGGISAWIDNRAVPIEKHLRGIFPGREDDVDRAVKEWVQVIYTKHPKPVDESVMLRTAEHILSVDHKAADLIADFILESVQSKDTSTALQALIEITSKDYFDTAVSAADEYLSESLNTKAGRASAAQEAYRTSLLKSIARNIPKALKSELAGQLHEGTVDVSRYGVTDKRLPESQKNRKLVEAFLEDYRREPDEDIWEYTDGYTGEGLGVHEEEGLAEVREHGADPIGINEGVDDWDSLLDQVVSEGLWRLLAALQEH